MKAAFEVLQGEIETRLAARESAQRAPVAQARGHDSIAGGDPCIRLEQRLAKLIHGHFARDVRKIGTDGRAFAVNHVTGSALPLAEEELFSGGTVAGHGWCRQPRHSAKQPGWQAHRVLRPADRMRACPPPEFRFG